MTTILLTELGTWFQMVAKPSGFSPRPAELEVMTVWTLGCVWSQRIASRLWRRHLAGTGGGAG